MKKKGILILVAVMLFAFTAGVVAAPAVQQITATLATDFKFTLDGKTWAPKDADGSAMYPIVYKDRTYLPVRAIGEALGIKVDWDKDTRTVILGEAAVEPVKEDPVKEDPVKEEPAPAAELAISPTTFDYNKNAGADGDVNITWGSATKITGITGSAMGGALKITLEEGTHYVVKDNGDGTGVLTIKTEVTDLLPVPITMVPDGTELTLTIKFDQGEKEFIIKVVS
ncbi:MAG TPA: hypothetical protein GXX58_03995 [Gelria sp.]|jgi:hypothetical protein|nr:hypothetical protein [Gelria sp.]